MSLLEQLKEDEKYSAFFFFFSILGLEPQTFHKLHSIPLPLDLKDRRIQHFCAEVGFTRFYEEPLTGIDKRLREVCDMTPLSLIWCFLATMKNKDLQQQRASPINN